MEKRGSHEAGSAALPVTPFAKAKLANYFSAKTRTHRTHALGDRALPDLRADAAAAGRDKLRLAYKPHVARDSIALMATPSMLLNLMSPELFKPSMFGNARKAGSSQRIQSS